MVLLSAVAADRTFFEWVGYFLQNNWQQFLFGTGNTMLIALTGTILGFLIGLVIGMIRTIPERHDEGWVRKAVRKVVTFLLVTYIEVFRGTPMMVQAILIFYGIPMLFPGVFLPVIPAGILIISINTGAYLAEIVRGGILAVDKGQFEAAHTVGMTHTQTMLHVVLPQALRSILPALGNEFVINIKDSSVLNVISVVELFFASRSVAGTYYRYFEVFLITCGIYFVCTFAVTRLLRLIERKLEGPKNFTIHGSQTTVDSELRIRGGGGIG